MSIRCRWSGLVLAAALLCALPAQAQREIPLQKVGELQPHLLSTQHPYVGGVEQVFEIHHPGATYLKVHFSKFELAAGDRLIVMTPDGTERYAFSDRGYKNKGEDFWVTSVIGDRVILRLQSANPTGAYGFDTDYYAYGIADLFPGPVDTESVCGVNNWMDVECYASSHPTEFDRAKRAVVVLFNGVNNCTGVKIGCPNQIMSNEHCVTSQGDVDLTEVRFEYQNSSCGGGTTGFSQGYLGDVFMQDNFTLDYSIFTVEGESADYEAAEFDPRLPAVGERIYISGHPAGNPKKLSIEDDTSPTGLCQVDVSPQNGRGTATDIGYFCDTTGGSSGSPVWSGDTHKLIGLHHFGGCANGGVRIDLIYPEIEPILMSCCENPPGATTVGAAVNGDNQIDVSWDDADLDTVVEYDILRARNSGGPFSVIATVNDSSPGVVGGASYVFSDTDVSGGSTYYYTVQSTDGISCRSDSAAEASATATGTCTLDPVFAGIGPITGGGSAICSLDLAWSAATPECGGPITYNVYRSIVPFTPSGSTLIAAGISSTAYQDLNQLVGGETYFYIVRAVDTAVGVEDENLVQNSASPIATCTTSSSCPENPFVDVSPEGPLTVCQNAVPVLSANLTNGTGPYHYQWLRDGVPIPGAVAPDYTPLAVGTGVYNVRVRADACPDEVFDGVSTAITVVNRPFFGGIVAADNPQDATCTANIDWNAATTVCGGPLDYAIYRDTITPVAQVPANLVAGGMTATSYVDLEGLANEQTYFYNVQARDASTGQFDGNAVEASVVTDGPFNGLQPFYVDDFENALTFSDWTVSNGPGPHTCGDWALSSSATQRPAGGSGSFIVANNQCGPILPRTSTKIDSAPVDMNIAGVVGVLVEANIRFDHQSTNGNETASIEVWDGAQWVLVWTDPNADVDQKISVDVSAHALGNSGFRVRFSYQNANADRFFAIDNAAIVTDVMSVCSTSPAGPQAVSSGSVTVARAAGAANSATVSWNASCSADYNLLYGDLATVGSYALLGSECSIGLSGSFAWSSIPGGNLYFLLVGTDGANSESSWGLTSGFAERNGAASSSQCGATTKDATGVCP